MPKLTMSGNEDSGRSAKLVRRRRRRQAPEVEALIEELAAKGYGGTEIHRSIRDDHPELPLPDVRTVQNRVREIAARDSGDGRGVGGTPDEAAAVFAVLPAMIDQSSGRITSVTAREAATLATLRPMVEVLEPWTRYLFARA